MTQSRIYTLYKKFRNINLKNKMKKISALTVMIKISSQLKGIYIVEGDFLLRNLRKLYSEKVCIFTLGVI